MTEIGEIITVAKVDGVMCFKLFNGVHHGKPVYIYVPVKQTNVLGAVSSGLRGTK